MVKDFCLVSRLFYFTEDGVAEVDNPMLSNIIDAVKSLDGVEIDTASITLNNGDSMDVGGGSDNQYICHARTNGDLYDLLNPTCPRVMQETKAISMNEELYVYPKCCIVPLDMVLLAMETFATTGELNSDLTWDNTLDYTPL